MTIALHVGAHKTASTSLQQLIRSNWKELSNQGISSVAKLLRTPPGAASELRDGCFLESMRPLIKKNGLTPGETVALTAALRDKLLSHRNGHSHMIISDELLLGPRLNPTRTLYPDARQRMEMYREVFSGEQLRVILYIRSQDSFIESTYLQDVHQRIISDFDVWLKCVDLESLHWSRVAADVAAVVGDHNLIVRPFESIKDGFEKFARDFFALFCDPTHLKIEEVHSNPAFSAKALDLAKAIGPLVNDDQWKHFRKLFQTGFQGNKYPKARLFSDEQRAHIVKKYSEDTRQTLVDYAKGWLGAAR